MKLIRSFGYAWQGISYCFNTQLNFRIHLGVLAGAVAMGFILSISIIEWLCIIGCSMLVFSLELVNTAIEYLCDTITKELNPSIKIIKDVAAGAVLIAAAGSVLAGLLIFLPKIVVLLYS